MISSASSEIHFGLPKTEYSSVRLLAAFYQYLKGFKVSSSSKKCLECFAGTIFVLQVLHRTSYYLDLPLITFRSLSFFPLHYLFLSFLNCPHFNLVSKSTSSPPPPPLQPISLFLFSFFFFLFSAPSLF